MYVNLIRFSRSDVDVMYIRGFLLLLHSSCPEVEVEHSLNYYWLILGKGY
jgi:hypothetical protein